MIVILAFKRRKFSI